MANKNEYVRKVMKVTNRGEGKWRMTINIDYSANTDCPLSVNGAPMNAGKPGARIAKWFGAFRFIAQMYELFQMGVEKNDFTDITADAA